MSIDLTSPGAAKMLAKQIKADIDAYCQKAYNDGFRSHLGASLIGRDCSRQLWYSFRWIDGKDVTGRMYRLWNRGHLEESRFIGWLRGIGFEVQDFTDDGKQFRIAGVFSHFGGSLDSKIKFPERYGVVQACALGEYKTSNTARFSKLCENGVKIEKPEHYAQMCSYGRKYNLPFALYLCINKNDDDIHVEIVPLDFKYAEQLEQKAARIISSRTPPARISDNPNYQDCKWCDFYETCHKGKRPNINCRTCANSYPNQNGGWTCAKYGDIPNNDAIMAACGEWSPIVNV